MVKTLHRASNELRGSQTNGNPLQSSHFDPTFLCDSVFITFVETVSFKCPRVLNYWQEKASPKGTLALPVLFGASSVRIVPALTVVLAVAVHV